MLRHLGREDAAEAGRDALRALRLLLCGALTLAAPSACSNDAAHATPGADGGSAFVHPTGGPEIECKGCHPQHVAEWKISSHAYAMKDPVFHAMVTLGQKETRGELGSFCVQCHSPMGHANGETVVTENAAGVFSQELNDLSDDATTGVTCVACHSMTEVKTVANADFVMGDRNVRRGPIADPVPAGVHESEASLLFTRTQMCGTCHVVVNPKNVALERTHIEWVESGFNGSKSCQDCHMPSSDGLASVGGPTREIHDHRMVGVDVSLLEPGEFPGYDDLRTRSEALLKGSARFGIRPAASGHGIDIDIENLAGHALPSGATADRELWVEMIVKDPDGKVAFESGTLDERGDLRVNNPDRTTLPGTDPSLVLYTQEMQFHPELEDPASTEPPRVVDFLWQPNAESTHLIDAEETAHRSYDLSGLAPGTYTAHARLLFRAFPPHLFRKLAEADTGLDPSVAGRVPTVEIAAADLTLSVN